MSLTGKVIVKKKEIANNSILMKLALILLKMECVLNSSVGKDILVDVDMIREAVVFAENLADICMDRVEKLKIGTAVKVKV